MCGALNPTQSNQSKGFAVVSKATAGCGLWKWTDRFFVSLWGFWVWLVQSLFRIFTRC